MSIERKYMSARSLYPATTTPACQHSTSGLASLLVAPSAESTSRASPRMSTRHRSRNTTAPIPNPMSHNSLATTNTPASSPRATASSARHKHQQQHQHQHQRHQTQAASAMSLQNPRAARTSTRSTASQQTPQPSTNPISKDALAILEAPDFHITWRIPSYKSQYFGKTICSHVCEHASKLKFQIVATTVVKDHYCFYLLCSNAHEFSVDERADVSWAISVGSDSETPEIRDGSMVFDHDNTNNFQKCCFDFMRLGEFRQSIDRLCNPSGDLVITASMLINTNFDPTSEPLAAKSFKRGDDVAVCAPDNGFWIARLQDNLILNKARETSVTVQWFEETPPNSGHYEKTPYADSISSASIHPVKLELQFHNKHGSKYYTIRETRTFLAFVRALRQQSDQS